jgi:glycosyltransferase involved in cell wall biosynthesis
VKNENISFIYVGHTVWLKGIYYLLLAWEEANLTGCQLKIVGKINEQLSQFLKTRFGKLPNVEYVGSVENPNLLYRQSHVFISPSLLDAHPATVSEALFCGLPVIVSEGCGAKTLVANGVNGFVIPAANSDAIASKMVWFSQNKGLIPEMGKEAVSSIGKLIDKNQEYGFEQHLLEIIELLQE